MCRAAVFFLVFIVSVFEPIVCGAANGRVCQIDDLTNSCEVADAASCAGYCNSESTNCGACCNIRNDCPNGDCWKEKPVCGYCSPDSSNCGAQCASQQDCPNGDCWKNKPSCAGLGAELASCAGYAGYCNSESTNCGACCNIRNDCPSGDCWKEEPVCGNAGYCSPDSSKCGAPCTLKQDCPNGDCWKNKPSCAGLGAELASCAGYAGYCNSESTNCGACCNIRNDCPSGDCWKEEPVCGYCNPDSSNCGDPCASQQDCPNGDCWKNKPSCAGLGAELASCAGYAGYCNSESTNCGACCNIRNDCPSGDCWKEEPVCGNAGYCSPDSSKCGAPCTLQQDCPNGDCWKNKPSCTMGVAKGTNDDNVIGTYMGAIPGGIKAQPLSEVTKSVNLIMLSFAKDPKLDGRFIPFSEWIQQGLTQNNIIADKKANPGRKFLISLGGAAYYGGTFGIQAGMSTDTWVANAVESVSSIIHKYGADGAEMQFEGGTGDAKFHEAMVGLLGGLKSKGFLTAIGPYYGGTWPHYSALPTNLYDYNNLQLYATGTNTVDGVVSMLNSAAADVGGDWSKIIAGFNTANRVPEPAVALQSISKLQGKLRGMFSWDIEHSQSNSPAYCLEDNSISILDDGQQPDTASCSW